MGQQEPPYPPAIDEAERQALIEKFQQLLRELDEIEAKLKEMKQGHQIH